ncbi:protein-disulfide isomerase [Planktotalea frisia]|jgi:protein-disulfide isomerase|uniref:Disulfide bond formation protein D n=3 Tax=Rhodobacterales TaxID=204455 RepID=A0A1L9NZI6_9RHOB|nr:MULTISPECIES: DsbA family protein [Rhodobacterales]MDU9006437.1 DsbA family protein [Sedimentitalea todarodis]OJI94651.1 disulfide bond formation protein D precursor [Planktotalea frisia]PZX35671.1 protein-disulfide isomerase [Planktotalea frisia]RLJ40556.1 protein-disulfide isomerase [Litoreibacter meonggei]UOA29855.1 Disulfide bond formation protein D [Pseudosulfitobacter sp. DSM 107133]
MKRFLATAALVMLPIAAMADGLDENRIKELVLEAIRENPGIVFEAAQLFEEQQQALQAQAAAEVLDTEKATLENDPNAPVLGNPEGDVTVVEFFDYNCPYCRRVKPEMEALLAADPNVRVVYREWPILGEGSVFAARAALASRNQGKYEEFHWAMMQLKQRAEEATIIRVAEDIGLDVAQLRRDMTAPEIEEHIQTSMRLAQSLGFSGTPSFVIGDSLAPGLIQADQMIELVDQARAAE